METALCRLVFRQVFLPPSGDADGVARRLGDVRRDRCTEYPASTITASPPSQPPGEPLYRRVQCTVKHCRSAIASSALLTSLDIDRRQSSCNQSDESS
jgi:hypothetical protein